MAEFQGFHYISARTEMETAPLLLLHGSGRDENELVFLADQIAPERPYLALRGRVAWEGGFAFFRRNADRSLNYEDIAKQTGWLARFIMAALDTGVLTQKPIMIGFSNGAIMASSLLLRQSALAAGAVLMRPLSPAPSEIFPDLAGRPVLIIAGDEDERRAPGDVTLMDRQLREAGAAVTTHGLATGHGLHSDEARLVRDWIDATFSQSVTARNDM